MKKVIFGKCLTIVFLAGSLFSQAFAVDATAAKAPPSGVDECSKELLLSYFPEQFVNESLKKFNVPQDQWAAINKELANKNDNVIKTVEEKASKMDPNPLKDPSQRQAAVKIFRETLLEIFSGVLKQHGVNDDQKIAQILDDVQHQKAVRFAQCMEKNMPRGGQDSRPPAPSAPVPVQGSKPDVSMNDQADEKPKAAVHSDNDGHNHSKYDRSHDDDTSIHPIQDDMDDTDDDLDDEEESER